MEAYRSTKFVLVLGLGIVSVSASAGVPAKGSAAATGEISALSERYGEHVPGELVVRLKESVSALGAQRIQSQLLQTLGLRAAGMEVSALATDDSVKVVRLRTKGDGELSEALARLQADPAVETAEPNVIFRRQVVGSPLASALPSDPDFSKLWGLLNVGQADSQNQPGTAGADINVAPVWSAGHVGSRDVVVAVIDTGIDWTHPDLVDNLYTNPGEIAGNGKDDDGNGFIDDIHGWNFVDNTANSSDDDDHGSHCAGTIGGTANNGQGVAGVSWNVRLVPVKFLGVNGGTLAAAVDSINYARRLGVKIMSNSWGGGGYTEILKKAIEDARDAGILFVAAAGNEAKNNDVTPRYPSGYQVDNIISVAAMDNRDNLAKFPRWGSHWGKKTVHLAAPGVNIWSTVRGGKYASFSGTSMATPHVSGAAALLWSINPTWDYATLKERLIRTSTPLRGLLGKIVAQGRLNVDNAFRDFTPPSIEPAENLWQSAARVVESAHPYANSLDSTFTVSVPGAKYLRVRFARVDVEDIYDTVSVETPAGEVVESLTGRRDNYVPGYVEGDTLVIRLKSDFSESRFGFLVDQVQFIQ